MMIRLRGVFLALFTGTFIVGCSTIVVVNRLDPETLGNKGIQYECVREVRVLRTADSTGGPQFRVSARRRSCR
jgi:hypothetical protein